MKKTSLIILILLVTTLLLFTVNLYIDISHPLKVMITEVPAQCIGVDC